MIRRKHPPSRRRAASIATLSTIVCGTIGIVSIISNCYRRRRPLVASSMIHNGTYTAANNEDFHRFRQPYYPPPQGGFFHSETPNHPLQRAPPPAAPPPSAMQKESPMWGGLPSASPGLMWPTEGTPAAMWPAEGRGTTPVFTDAFPKEGTPGLPQGIGLRGTTPVGFGASSSSFGAIMNNARGISPAIPAGVEYSPAPPNYPPLFKSNDPIFATPPPNYYNYNSYGSGGDGGGTTASSFAVGGGGGGGGGGTSTGAGGGESSMGASSSTLTAAGFGGGGGGGGSNGYNNNNQLVSEEDMNFVCSLYMDNLPPDIEPKHLRSLFAQFGEVIAINIMYQRQRSPQATLAGFVNLRGVGNAQKAILMLNEKHVFRPEDGPIHVRFKGAKSEAPHIMPGFQHPPGTLLLPIHQQQKNINHQQDNVAQQIFSSPPPEFMAMSSDGAATFNADNQNFAPAVLAEAAAVGGGGFQGGGGAPATYNREGISTYIIDPPDATALWGRSRVTNEVHEELPRIAPDEEGAFHYQRLNRTGYGHGYSYFHAHIGGKTPLKHFEKLNTTYDAWGPPPEKRIIIDDNKWSIFVGGLPLMLDLNHLYQAFEKFGPVDRVKTVKPRKGQTRYCGFVNMTYLADAHQAIKTLSKVRNYTLMQHYFGKAVADEIGDGYLVLRFVGEINAGTSDPSSGGANSQYANFQRISSDLRMLRQQLAVLQRIPNVPSTMYSHHPGFWPVPPGNQPTPSAAMMHWPQAATPPTPPSSMQSSPMASGQTK